MQTLQVLTQESLFEETCIPVASKLRHRGSKYTKLGILQKSVKMFLSNGIDNNVGSIRTFNY